MSEDKPILATKAQIDLCHIKDTEFINKIDTRLQELALYLPKSVKQVTIQNNKFFIKQLSIVIYFFKSLIYKNEQTLGETYTNISASKLKNLIYLSKLLFQNSLLRLKLDTNYSNIFKWVTDISDVLFNLFDLTLFKRNSSTPETDTQVNSHFKTIGQLQLMKFVVTNVFNIYRSKFDNINHSNNNKDIKQLVYKDKECLLCSSENITNPSVGKCGHIFCYNCYIKWTSKNLSCPLCRFKIHPREVVLLRN